jgi:hypothetical protein
MMAVLLAIILAWRILILQLCCDKRCGQGNGGVFANPLQKLRGRYSGACPDTCRRCRAGRHTPDKNRRIALNVDNLFDRSYYASSYCQLWVAPGTTRTATLTLSYRR